MSSVERHLSMALLRTRLSLVNTPDVTAGVIGTVRYGRIRHKSAFETVVDDREESEGRNSGAADDEQCGGELWVHTCILPLELRRMSDNHR